MDIGTDNELIEKIKNHGCEKSIIELAKRHTPLCFSFYHRFASVVDVEEKMQEKEALVYQCAMSFDAAKGVKFSTWLGNQIRYQCLNIMNRRKCVYLEPSELNYHVDQTAQHSDSEETEDAVVFVQNILSQLKDKRIEEIYRLRYFGKSKKDAAWSRIAKKLNVSTQTAINLHERGREILKKKLLSKECFDTI